MPVWWEGGNLPWGPGLAPESPHRPWMGQSGLRAHTWVWACGQSCACWGGPAVCSLPPVPHPCRPEKVSPKGRGGTSGAVGVLGWHRVPLVFPGRRGGWGRGAEPGAGGARGWGASPALCGPCLMPLPAWRWTACAPSAGASCPLAAPSAAHQLGGLCCQEGETGGHGGLSGALREAESPAAGLPLSHRAAVTRHFCRRCRRPRKALEPVTGSLFSSAQGRAESSESSEGSGPQSRGGQKPAAGPQAAGGPAKPQTPGPAPGDGRREGGRTRPRAARPSRRGCPAGRRSSEPSSSRTECVASIAPLPRPLHSTTRASTGWPSSTRPGPTG